MSEKVIIYGTLFKLPVSIINIETAKTLFKYQSKLPFLLNEYFLLIKTRRSKKYFIVIGISFINRFYVKGFHKFKVLGYLNMSDCFKIKQELSL